VRTFVNGTGHRNSVRRHLSLRQSEKMFLNFRLDMFSDIPLLRRADSGLLHMEGPQKAKQLSY